MLPLAGTMLSGSKNWRHRAVTLATFQARSQVCQLLWQLIGDARGATPAQQRDTKEADE
jgi:hypothetical protein